MDDEKASGASAERIAVGTADPLWRNSAYRLAIAVAESAWQDSIVLDRNRLTRALADQLYRAACSIGANLTDGYGRTSGKDRVRFWEYSLSSARECHFWYQRARHVLPAENVARQTNLLNQICALLLTMIPRERKRILGETNTNH